MANFLQRALLRHQPGEKGAPSTRSSWTDFEAMLQNFSYQGSTYGITQTLTGSEERIGTDFSALVAGALKSNGVIFACILTRMLVFSEARFQFRRFEKGRPGDLFGDQSLKLLEKPWPNGTTGDLLARMEMDASLAGNSFWTVRGTRLKRLRPDWVTIVCASEYEAGPNDGPDDLDADLLGFLYQPGGYTSSRRPVFLFPEQVAHYAPIPDPIASYRGMSWITPVTRELEADSAATAHKLKFFELGATPNMVVKVDPATSFENFKLFKELFDSEHAGVANAYKTIFLGGGADAKVVGSDMKQLDFSMTQGAGETRIAAAAGTPPVIVGLSEGLQSATYSNYGQARRRFADGTLRPLWRNAAGSLASIVKVPDGAQLYYDDRDIPFLREDMKDAAEIEQIKGQNIRQLVDAGFTPESAVEAVEAGDLSLLVHTGLYSVQLRPPTLELATSTLPDVPIDQENVPTPGKIDTIPHVKPNSDPANVPTKPNTGASSGS